MKLLVPERISYKGPDPPPEDWQVEEEPQPPAEQAAPGKPAPKGKALEVVAPVEVQKSPQVELADKSVRRFMKTFMTSVIQLQTDLNEYRV